MNTGALPYLKQIADALNSNKGGDKKRDEELTSIAKNISTATVTNNNVSIAANENTKAISETLAKGLIVTVQEGSSEVQKSIFALIFEMLQSALYATVTENGQTVVKGIAQLVSEQNTILSGIASTVSTISAEATLTREALYDPNNANNTIYGKVSGIGNDTDIIRGTVSGIGNDTDVMRSTLTSIDGTVTSIDGKIS